MPELNRECWYSVLSFNSVLAPVVSARPPQDNYKFAIEVPQNSRMEKYGGKIRDNRWRVFLVEN